MEFGRVVIDPFGQTKAGFTIIGRISRKDFGITYNAALETGGVMPGDEIKINAEIQSADLGILYEPEFYKIPGSLYSK